MLISYENNCSANWLYVFRACLGTYMFIWFASLFPYSPELSAIPGLNSFSPFPGIVELGISYKLVLVTGCLFSICLVLKKTARASAFVLWLVWLLLLSSNPFIINPAYPFIGLILVALTLMPTDKYPAEIFGAIWLVMAASYSYSGYTKLLSPSWVDGSAIYHSMNYFLARPGINELVLALPELFLKLLTWATLLLELMFLPLYFWKPARKYIWLAALGMHIGIMLTFDFLALSAAMFILHFFTFNPEWSHKS